MKNLFLVFSLLISFSTNIFSDDNYKIDLINGKIYSSATYNVKLDSNFASNRIQGIEIAKQDVKTYFFKALQKINIYESVSVLNYFEDNSEDSQRLYSLIDNAKLDKVEYPNLKSVKYTYSIDIYGNNSLMSIVMDQRKGYTEDLKSFIDYPYTASYTGIIIDARGELTSFDGFKVKVQPALFITVKDEDGRIIFNQNNIFPEIIKTKGMVRYSYDIKENFTDRVGKNPLKIVADGVGDKSGSMLVVTLINAKKILSSDITKNAIQNGNVVVIIEP